MSECAGPGCTHPSHGHRPKADGDLYKLCEGRYPDGRPCGRTAIKTVPVAGERWKVAHVCGQEHVYPATARRNPLDGLGRNDPCPCRSGKKAKRCCLRKVADLRAEVARLSKHEAMSGALLKLARAQEDQSDAAE